MDEKIKATCWFCGKKFNIEIANVYAGRLFCSDLCKIENLKKELELEKKENEINKTKGDSKC